MVLKTTRWSPDTCECVIEYQWDSETTEANRTHTLSNIIKCPAHQSSTDNDAYNVVLDENPRKSRSLETILANAPTVLFDTVNGVRQLKPSITFNISWSGTAPNRVLTVSFTGISLTTTQKNTLQTALNTRFGSGKVIIA